VKNLEFPIIGTKVKGLKDEFDINSPSGRKKYFKAKIGTEIAQIKKYLGKGNTFVAYMLGKKNSGKGTYTKLMTEIFGSKYIAHVSVGDLIREIDDWEAFKKTKKYERMKSYYRGYISWDEAVDAHLGRSQSRLLPDEFILALLKAHIDDLPGKCLFIDGLPRTLDQVSYSLFFRDLINYRDDPDIFVLIDIPESVIAERIKYRVICPICNTSRNKKLLITSKIEYNAREKKFYLLCDNPDCPGNGKEKMVGKQGDDMGLEPIRERLNSDETLLRQTFNLYGVPKVLLRNHVPVAEVNKYFDSYEITPEYGFEWDSKKKEVRVTQKPWSVKDDNGKACYSLLAAPVVVVFIKQLVEVLGLLT
jgi:adenylate kinase family enzyme